ncbi:MAG: hypothetical protein FWG43_06225 [Clostridiales bacterium]|nr:hypothetical protein [Clostridiales bacterium]
MANKRDYYEVLGLAKGASLEEIKSAAEKLGGEAHWRIWVSSCLLLKWEVFVGFSTNHLRICSRVSLNGLLE